MKPEDKELFKKFIRSLPDSDNYYLLLDVHKDSAIDAWMHGIESGRTVSLMALDGDQMAGYCNIHLSELPWTRHVGEIRLSVAGAYRGQGLGQALARDVFLIAKSHGLEKVWARMPVSQKGAQKVFQGLGFQPEALLADFVKDSSGRKQDLVMMSHDVTGFVN
jgi:ribosomal protein S18 acetylase RimI-like enzyme